MRLIVWCFVCLTLLFAVLKGNQFGAYAADVDEDEVPVTEEQSIPAGGNANAEETEEDYEEEEIALVASPDAHTRVLFPDFPTKKIPVGKEVTVLVGFSNSGSSPFTLTSIGAHLHSPYDFSYYIQNFTERDVFDGVVEPGAQVSLEYIFKPDPSLEPLEFHLSGFVTYNNSENMMFRSTFVNGTIELIEAQSDFDIRGIFTWFLGVAALGLIAYVGFNTFASPEQKKIVKRVGSAASTPQTPKKLASEDSGFLDSLYTPSKSQAAFGSRKPKKPRSSKKDE